MKRITTSLAFWVLWYLSFVFFTTYFNPVKWIQDVRFIFLVCGWALNIIFLLIKSIDDETR